MGVDDLRAYLTGTWRLRRRIEDRRAGQTGTFDGTAVFREQADGALRYEETGTLTMGAHSGPASRVYLYRFPDGPAAADVRFDDGRAFHPLDLTTGRWRGTHMCDPDTYDGDVEALTDDEWRATWTVSGPRKDLTLETRYSRG